MIVIIWLLMGGVVLFSAFTGCIYGFMIEKPPIEKIDSWEDLHHKWKDKQIIAIENGPFADFVTYDNSDMARDFKSRIEINPIENFLNRDFREKSMERIVSGNYVFIFEYYALKYLGIISKSVQEFKRKNGRKHGVDFHVSRSGSGTLPYFLMIKKKDKFNSTRSLNKA
jgi:hypothetical protein